MNVASSLYDMSNKITSTTIAKLRSLSVLNHFMRSFPYMDSLHIQLTFDLNQCSAVSKEALATFLFSASAANVIRGVTEKHSTMSPWAPRRTYPGGKVEWEAPCCLLLLIRNAAGILWFQRCLISYYEKNKLNQLFQRFDSIWEMCDFDRKRYLPQGQRPNFLLILHNKKTTWSTESALNHLVQVNTASPIPLYQTNQ